MIKIHYPTTLTEVDLRGIIDLQQANLSKNISLSEAQNQGFVSVKHDLATLKAQGEEYPHIVAKEGEKVIGYALVMLKKMANSIPMLVPLFNTINKMTYKEKPLNSFNYFVMGQVCIAKEYRGLGIFHALYERLSIQMANNGFDIIITEIDKKNMRSRRAHQKVGFTELKTYHVNGQDWIIVGLDISSYKKAK